jgi:hypothetical protein
VISPKFKGVPRSSDEVENGAGAAGESG